MNSFFEIFLFGTAKLAIISEGITIFNVTRESRKDILNGESYVRSRQHFVRYKYPSDPYRERQEDPED